jgi:hypothetical protein
VNAPHDQEAAYSKKADANGVSIVSLSTTILKIIFIPIAMNAEEDWLEETIKHVFLAKEDLYMI